MNEDLEFFFWVGGVLGWLMCLHRACYWVCEDCGCKHENTSEYNDENIVVAIPIDE